LTAVDDVSDLRTRLIYASLADDNLVQQLLDANAVASRRNRTPRPRAQGQVIDVRDVIDLDTAARLGGYYLG
jgi:hypothetical protein